MMNTSTRLLVATGLTGLMSFTLLTPVAYAQDMGAPNDPPPVLQLDLAQQPGDDDRPGDDRRGGRPDGRGGIAGLVCSTDGASALETRLADLATALKLTTEQQPLFDAYKTAALTAQTSFADNCPKPAAGADTQAAPDALDVLKHRQARTVAELDAINAVLPSFEALYASLTDTQKAALMPLVGPHHGRHADHRGGDDRGGRHHDKGRDGDFGRGDEPGRGNDPGRGGDRGRN